MSRRSRRTAASGTLEERGETKVERHRKKPKGWRGDTARHAEASKRAEEKRLRTAAKKAMTRPPKRQAVKDAKKEYRRKRGMPEEEGK